MVPQGGGAGDILDKNTVFNPGLGQNDWLNVQSFAWTPSLPRSGSPPRGELYRRWRTVDPDQLDEVAADLWADERLRDVARAGNCRLAGAGGPRPGPRTMR